MFSCIFVFEKLFPLRVPSSRVSQQASATEESLQASLRDCQSKLNEQRAKMVVMLKKIKAMDAARATALESLLALRRSALSTTSTSTAGAEHVEAAIASLDAVGATSTMASPAPAPAATRATAAAAATGTSTSAGAASSNASVLRDDSSAVAAAPTSSTPVAVKRYVPTLAKSASAPVPSVASPTAGSGGNSGKSQQAHTAVPESVVSASSATSAAPSSFGASSASASKARSILQKSVVKPSPVAVANSSMLFSETFLLVYAWSPV